MLDQDFLKMPVSKIAGLIAAVLILSGCSVQPNNGPAFSNMALLGDKLYVAYKSPDAVVKFDTIAISFDYNYSKVKSINVRATLDSEKTWISLGSITPDNSNKASLTWVPKDDPITFNYCGKKEAFIRVSDSISKEYINSDSFTIVGAVPFILISPKRGDTYLISDTIRILFTQNRDLTSDFLTSGFLFVADTGYDFKSIDNSTEKLSQSLPIKNFVTKFTPRNFVEEARNYAHPISIVVADYGPSPMILQADSITIVQ